MLFGICSSSYIIIVHLQWMEGKETRSKLVSSTHIERVQTWLVRKGSNGSFMRTPASSVSIICFCLLKQENISSQLSYFLDTGTERRNRIWMNDQDTGGLGGMDPVITTCSFRRLRLDQLFSRETQIQHTYVQVGSETSHLTTRFPSSQVKLMVTSQLPV